MHCNYTQEQITDIFSLLEPLIESHNLADGFLTETTPRHDVEANEFMLMCGNDTELQFKHRDTRNYIYLRCNWPDDPWKLIVPVTSRPFNLGKFDKYN